MGDSNVIPTTAGRLSSQRSDRSIGALLIDAGRLKPDDAERILHLQREQGMRFGDAAIKLGFLTPTDVEFALSRQFSYPYPLHGDNGISEDLVAAYAPFTPQVEALRAVRTQLMLRWFDSDSAHKTLAIVSAEHDEGRSFIAANLAVAFSQLGEHTLLVDADLRDPCQHRFFGLDNRAGLSAVLSGRGGPEAIQRVSALVDLSVLPAGAVPPNPAELLSRPPFEQLLAHLTTNFDIIILDTPPAAGSTDAQIIAARTGAAVLVARSNATRISQVHGVADSLADAKATVVGIVLNEF